MSAAGQAKAVAETELSSGNGHTIGDAFAQGVRSGISGAAGSVASAAGSLAASARSAASSAMGSSGYSIGSQFASGLASGLRSGTSTVSSAASALAQAVINRTRLVTKTHSPSRVAMEIGGYFAEGLGLGMENGTRFVQAAASRLGAQMGDLNPVVSGLQGLTRAMDSAENGTDGLSVLRSMADSLTAIRSSMLELLASQAETSTREQLSGISRTSREERDDDAQQLMEGARETLQVLREDQNGALRSMATMLVSALNMVRLEVDGEEIGRVVAPAVSELIAQGAVSRRYG